MAPLQFGRKEARKKTAGLWFQSAITDVCARQAFAGKKTGGRYITGHLKATSGTPLPPGEKKIPLERCAKVETEVFVYFFCLILFQNPEDCQNWHFWQVWGGHFAPVTGKRIPVASLASKPHSGGGGSQWYSY